MTNLFYRLLHCMQYSIYFGIRTFRSCESAKFQLGLKFDKKLKQIDWLILSLVRLHTIQHYFGTKTFRSCELVKVWLGLKFSKKIDLLILSLVRLHTIQYYFGIKTFRSCKSVKVQLGLKFGRTDEAERPGLNDELW